MGKELTPKQTTKIYESQINLERVYEIVFGYHGHLRYDFNELEEKLNELVESFVGTTVANSDYRDAPNLEKDLKELENLRKSFDYQEEDYHELCEVYSIVYDDEDARWHHDFDSLRKKLKKHFPEKKEKPLFWKQKEVFISEEDQ